MFQRLTLLAKTFAVQYKIVQFPPKVIYSFTLVFVAIIHTTTANASFNLAAAPLEEFLNPFSDHRLVVRASEKSCLTHYVGIAGDTAIDQPSQSPINDPESAARAFLAMEEIAEMFGLINNADTLILDRVSLQTDGRTIVKFRQSANGLPVVHTGLNVMLDSNLNLMSISGVVSPDAKAAGGVFFTPIFAENAALNWVGSKYSVDHTTELHVAASTPVIYDSKIIEDVSDRPAKGLYKVEIENHPLSQHYEIIREVVFVDYLGEIIHFSYSDIQTIDNYGAYDMSWIPPNPANMPGVLVCDETDTTCAAATLPQQLDAIEAHSYIQDVDNFFTTMVPGQNTNLPATINGNAILNIDMNYPYDNAFYFPPNQQFGFTEAMAVQDIVGHEYTHAVTAAESGLLYFKQPGAINESLSDIFGEMIDLTYGAANPAITDLDGPQYDYLLGEGSSAGVVRNMRDPDAAPPMINGYPDRITSPNYYCGFLDWGGVHINSSVTNKLAYLLMEGDTFNGQTVQGIGIPKVARLFDEAQRNFLAPGSDFADLALILQRSCANLVLDGAFNAGDCTAIRDALVAVELAVDPCGVQNPQQCPAGQGEVEIFSEDFELGQQPWNLNGSWYVAPGSPWTTTNSNSLIGINVNQAIVAEAGPVNPITLPNNAILEFTHDHFFPFNWGAGFVEFNDTPLDTANFITNPYQGNVAALAITPPEAWGTPAFVNSNGGFMTSQYDLSTFAGQTGTLKFNLVSNSFVGFPGWNIDDVRIYTCGQPVAMCDNFTIETVANGAWDDPNTWSGARVPDMTDAVRINANHQVDYNFASQDADGITRIQSLCNFGTLQAQPNVDININAARQIMNQGIISGADGSDGFTYMDQGQTFFQDAQPGNHVILEALQINNMTAASIQAGRGGHEILYNFEINSTSIPNKSFAEGGAGGDVVILADRLYNNGRIGPQRWNLGADPSQFQNFQQPNQLPANILDGGNGGSVDAYIQGTDATTPPNKIMPVRGGDGGDVVIVGGLSVRNDTQGEICSGNGGYSDASMSSAFWGGRAGELTFTAPETNNRGTLCMGASGTSTTNTLRIDPNQLTMEGTDARVFGADRIEIFGGHDWDINLQNLAPGAIEANRQLEIAAGMASRLEVSGGQTDVIRAGQKITLSTYELDILSGHTEAQIFTAPNLEQRDGRIIRAGAVVAPSIIDLDQSGGYSILVRVINLGSVTDIFHIVASEYGNYLDFNTATVTVKPFSQKLIHFAMLPPVSPLAENTILFQLKSMNDPQSTHQKIVRVRKAGGTVLADSDFDRIPDLVEQASCSDWLDVDTDDDGLNDRVEDINGNGQLDWGETNPCNPDTDGDTIPDGTELGISMAVPDPDGAGPISGTDPLNFVPDADPFTTTLATSVDSDGDGVNDNLEDSNQNGQVDPGESDPDGVPVPVEMTEEIPLPPWMLLMSAALYFGVARRYRRVQ